MSNRKKKSVNNQQKFDKSSLKSNMNVSGRPEREIKSSHLNIHRRGEIIHQEMNTSSKSKQQCSSTSLSETDARLPSSPSVNNRDCDGVKIIQTTTDNIPLSYEKANDPTSTVAADTAPCSSNTFANDGSFMAIFRKKIQEDQMNKETKGVKRTVETEEKEKISPKPGSSFNLPLVGRRKGPKMLKTGIVAKKVKEEEKEEDTNSDAWSKYLAEVRKYKSQKCIEDDGGSTPLVK